MIKATFQEVSVIRTCPRNVQEKRKPQEKYLRESYYHHIKCITATFLAAFMWRRLLNSTALAITTHRRPERVFDGTSTQVATQIIDKCRMKRVQEGLYNRKDPPWGRDQKKLKKEHCNNLSLFVLSFNWLIWTLTSLDYKFNHISVFCFIQIIF